MEARRQEDQKAANIVDAIPLGLDMWDLHYRSAIYGYREERDGITAVEGRFAELVASEASRTFFVPVGWPHNDHEATAALALNVAKTMPEACWALYSELPYRIRDDMKPLTGLIHSRSFAAWRAAGFKRVSFAAVTDYAAEKTAAAECYASQLRQIDAGPSCRATEKYWLMQPAGG